MFLAALHDEFQPGGSVGRNIGRGDSLWCGINHHIGTGQQIGQTAADWQARRTHRITCGTSGGENRKSALRRNRDPPVCGDIGDPGNLHVGLERYGIGHPLADDAISVDGNAQFTSVLHPNYSSIDAS